MLAEFGAVLCYSQRSKVDAEAEIWPVLGRLIEEVILVVVGVENPIAERGRDLLTPIVSDRGEALSAGR